MFIPTLANGAAKRKMESCHKKIKQLGRRESPSSEDSSLEDLHHVEAVKEEPQGEFFCPECGEGGVSIHTLTTHSAQTV